MTPATRRPVRWDNNGVNDSRASWMRTDGRVQGIFGNGEWVDVGRIA
jgi:hypothetical protein